MCFYKRLEGILDGEDLVVLVCRIECNSATKIGLAYYQKYDSWRCK
jgi:hypothetical protein